MNAGAIVVGLDMPPHHLNPLEPTDYGARQILSLMYPALLVRSSGRYQPGPLVDYYQILPEQNRILIRLKANACWTNGDRLLPQHYASALLAMVERKSAMLGFFDFVAGIVDRFENDGSGEIGVFCVGRTLEIETVYIPTHIEAILSSHIWLPIREYGCSVPEHRVTAGPFKITSRQDNRLVLSDACNTHKIEYKFSIGLYEQVDQFRDGNLDLTCPTHFPFDLIRESHDPLLLRNEPSNIQFVLYYNAERLEPLKDVSCRRYLSREIKTAEIAKRLYDGVISWREFIPIPLLPTLQTGYPSDGALPEKAFEIESLTITCSDYYPNEFIAREIADHLKSCGIVHDAYIETVTFSQLGVYLTHGSFELLLDLSAPFYDHPLATIESFWENTGENDAEELMDLFGKYSDAELEEDCHKSYWLQANELLKENLPCFPILNGRHLYFQSDNAKSLVLNANGTFVIRRGEKY